MGRCASPSARRRSRLRRDRSSSFLPGRHTSSYVRAQGGSGRSASTRQPGWRRSGSSDERCAYGFSGRASHRSMAGASGRRGAGLGRLSGRKEHGNTAGVRIWIACTNRKESFMDTVTSKDGTTIAFDRLGDGPPVILVCGGSTDRMANAPLAELLAEHFTVFNYDRRGRGDSGDAAPYAVEREVEDLDAVIDAGGGSAFVYGTSSGGALALEAAASGLAITKLAMWEPPFSLDESSRPPQDQVERYDEMISAGHRGDAVEYFMTKVVASRPSSSPTRAPSHSGRDRESWLTRSPTTLLSWATTLCRQSWRPSRHRRS